MAPRSRVEKRADADDGVKYSLAEMKEYYGEKKGQKKWDAAGTKAVAEPKAKAKAKVKAKAKAKVKESKPRKPTVDAELLEAAVKEATSKPAKTLQLPAPVDDGMPKPEHFKVVETPVGEVSDGGLLIEVVYISADPYMRGRIKSAAVTESPSVISGFVSGRVLVSKSADWFPGDLLGGSLPYTTVQVVPEAALKGCWKLSGLLDESSLSHGIGVLGMPGATAYGGFFEILKPKRPKKGEENGETVFISAASGAVGQLVGQLAKIAGCITIGSAGGPEKCKTLKEKFGYDHAIDYKACKDADELKAKIKECSPEGIDMYFENVGGMHFDAALACMKPGGRVAVCGCISAYNSGGALGSNSNALNIGSLIYAQVRIEGFICARWLFEKTGKCRRDMARYLKQGKVVVTETETQGIENWGSAFGSLFTGANNGKVCVKVGDLKPLKKETPKAD